MRENGSWLLLAFSKPGHGFAFAKHRDVNRLCHRRKGHFSILFILRNNLDNYLSFVSQKNRSMGEGVVRFPWIFFTRLPQTLEIVKQSCSVAHVKSRSLPKPWRTHLLCCCFWKAFVLTEIPHVLPWEGASACIRPIYRTQIIFPLDYRTISKVAKHIERQTIQWRYRLWAFACMVPKEVDRRIGIHGLWDC